jgi:NAD(P)-dependent dehydrogenase (short-subunit alcohol dehydrogenase family)
MMYDMDDSPIADYPHMMTLSSSTFAVVGGGFGIGRQVAHALRSAGARVAVVDRDYRRARQVAGEVDGYAYTVDATDRDSVVDLFRAMMSQEGELHGVIDIVGMARYGRLLDLRDEDWAWQFAGVFHHAHLIAQQAAPLINKSGGGSITFVSSVAGVGSSPNLAAYGAAKASLISLVRTAAVELGPLNIRVNSVAPGIVRTPRSRANTAWTDELLTTNINNTPLRRLATPDDVAAALLMLALPLARHVTGQNLIVDGGLSLAVGVKTPEPATPDVP